MSPMNTGDARYLADVAEVVEPEIKAELPVIAADAAPVVAKVATDFSHWIHLADGRVITAIGTMTKWFDSEDPKDKGIPVIGSYVNPSYVPAKLEA
jgi:hypothetical protein